MQDNEEQKVQALVLHKNAPKLPLETDHTYDKDRKKGKNFVKPNEYYDEKYGYEKIYLPENTQEYINDIMRKNGYGCMSDITEQKKKIKIIENKLKSYYSHELMEDLDNSKDLVFKFYNTKISIKIGDYEIPLYFDEDQERRSFYYKADQDIKNKINEAIEKQSPQSLIINNKYIKKKVDETEVAEKEVEEEIKNAYKYDKNKFTTRNKFVFAANDLDKRLVHLIAPVKFSFGICELYCYFKNKQIDEINRKRQEFENKIKKAYKYEFNFLKGDIKKINNSEINRVKEEYEREFDRITGGCCYC